jgi:hypothetical protein
MKSLHPAKDVSDEELTRFIKCLISVTTEGLECLTRITTEGLERLIPAPVENVSSQTTGINILNGKRVKSLDKMTTKGLESSIPVNREGIDCSMRSPTTLGFTKLTNIVWVFIIAQTAILNNHLDRNQPKRNLDLPGNQRCIVHSIHPNLYNTWLVSVC